MKQSTYQPSHRSEISPRPSGERSIRRRAATLSAFTGLAVASTLGLASCDNSPDKEEKPYVYTDRDCRPMPKRLQEVPYDIESGDLKYLIRQIKTVDRKGPLEDGPCYDEALELAKQQSDKNYPDDGTALLPKFLVPEGMTLRELKNDLRAE